MDVYLPVTARLEVNAVVESELEVAVVASDSVMIETELASTLKSSAPNDPRNAS